MTADVIPFPNCLTVRNIPRDTVHVEPSVVGAEWDVVLSPASGGLSSVHGTYGAFNEADTQARLVAQIHGAEYVEWRPTGGAA